MVLFRRLCKWYETNSNCICKLLMGLIHPSSNCALKLHGYNKVIKRENSSHEKKLKKCIEYVMRRVTNRIIEVHRWIMKFWLTAMIHHFSCFSSQLFFFLERIIADNVRSDKSTSRMDYYVSITLSVFLGKRRWRVGQKGVEARKRISSPRKFKTERES